MSASFNQVELIGRLGRDPEMRYTPSGKSTTRFSIAVDNSYKNADGTKVESTDWFNVECWDRLAEIVNEYISKGRLVFVQGRLKIDEYESEGQKKQYTKIVARVVQMLDRAPNGSNSNGASQSQAPDELFGEDIQF